MAELNLFPLLIISIHVFIVSKLANSPKVRHARELAGGIVVLTPGLATTVEALCNYSRTNKEAFVAYFIDSLLTKMAFYASVICAIFCLMFGGYSLWQSSAIIAQWCYVPTFFSILSFIICTVCSGHLPDEPITTPNNAHNAGLVASSISELASAIQVWERTKESGGIADNNMLLLASSGREAVQRAEAALRLMSHVPPEITQAILKNIEEAKTRFIAALRDPANNRQTKDQEERLARQMICSELARLKNFNNGKLSTDLERLWVSFSCENQEITSQVKT